MKKVISYLCLVVMLFQLFPMCTTVAYADGENIITVASVSANSGEKSVKVDLTLKNINSLVGMILKISYPEDIVLSNVEKGSALSTLDLATFAKPYLNPLVPSWDGINPDNSNGTILSLYFDIPDTAVAGTKYPITVTFDPIDIYTINDTGFIDVPTLVVNGSITVEEPRCEHTLTSVAEKSATCTVDGSKAYYECSKCHAKFWDDKGENPVAAVTELVIPAIGHKWNAGTVTTEATCKTPGTKLFQCTNTGCKETKTANYSVEDGTHTYATTSWQFRDGDFDSHYQPCDCGAAAGEKKEAHDWKVDETRSTAATCTKDGITYYTCSICKGEKTETIKAPGHKWDAGTVTIEATCATDGTKLFQCTNTGCTETKTENYSVESGTHTYTTTTWQSRENDTVYHYKACDCGKGIGLAEAHKWNNGVVTVEPTHTTEGVKSFQCTVCEATKTEVVPKLTEHSYGDWSKLDDTYHHRTCVCGNEQKEAHKWNDGVVTVEPTEDKDGTRTLTCTACGATKDVAEPYHVHDYDKDFDSVKWSANASYHWKKCACGEISYKSAHIASDWIVDGYPNPVSIGMMHKECMTCGYVLAREILPSTGSITRPVQTRQYTITASSGDHGSITHEGKTVFNRGETISYAIFPDEGYEIASVLVNGADVGAVERYTFWNISSDYTISATFREIPAAHTNPFIDVTESDAYYDAVMYVYENGLFKGVSETEFAPDTTMTRAMFVTVLGRMAGVNPLLYQKSSFTDVELGQWYSPYVEWAAHSGIVLGYGDGTFGLNDEITVEQAAVILKRYAAFTGRSIYTLRTLDDFADAADVSDWAVYSMKWIVNSGIYTGEDGMLFPKSPAKRSLIAAMLYNYAN